jgi:hypothetical protein
MMSYLAWLVWESEATVAIRWFYEASIILDIPLDAALALICAGLVGPVGDREAELCDVAELAQLRRDDLAGFSLASAKRVAYSGRINETAEVCVASLPGKFVDQWDAAVEEPETNLRVSLACVFLTDRESGLGVHAIDPDNLGNPCLCRQIYGRVPHAAYLSCFECNRDSMGDEPYVRARDFARADAEAMGLIFLERGYRSDRVWQQLKSEAMGRAETRCNENQGRAPWGCKWFEVWKRNMLDAVDRGQRLSAYYFPGCVGKGKVAWDDLANPDIVREARRESGLGASQTVEVAWMDLLVLKYDERDIAGFIQDMRNLRGPNSEGASSGSASGSMAAPVALHSVVPTSYGASQAAWTE